MNTGESENWPRYSFQHNLRFYEEWVPNLLPWCLQIRGLRIFCSILFGLSVSIFVFTDTMIQNLLQLTSFFDIATNDLHWYIKYFGNLQAMKR